MYKPSSARAFVLLLLAAMLPVGCAISVNDGVTPNDEIVGSDDDDTEAPREWSGFGGSHVVTVSTEGPWAPQGAPATWEFSGSKQPEGDIPGTSCFWSLDPLGGFAPGYSVTAEHGVAFKGVGESVKYWFDIEPYVGPGDYPADLADIVQLRFRWSYSDPEIVDDFVSFTYASEVGDCVATVAGLTGSVSCTGLQPDTPQDAPAPSLSVDASWECFDPMGTSL